MPDLLEKIVWIVGRKVHITSEPSCVTSISTVPPILAHRQQCRSPFPPTEVFGGDRQIRCPPTKMKSRMIGWNAWHLRFYHMPGGCLSTLCDCRGVWDQKHIHFRTGVHTIGHLFCYFPGSCSCSKKIIDNCLPLIFCRQFFCVYIHDIISKLKNKKTASRNKMSIKFYIPQWRVDKVITKTIVTPWNPPRATYVYVLYR